MDLIYDLISGGYLKTASIIDAFRKIKRQDFILSGSANEAEINAPIPIGFGQTISQPATVAFMLELLQPKREQKILDIGSGSGWTTTLLAEIVGKQGKVYAIEKNENLKKFGEKNISKYNFIKKGIADIFCLDGREGLPEYAPFDRILVSAAADIVPPAFLGQTAIGGRIVIPIGRPYESQDIVVIDKIKKNKFKEKKYPGFIFVPLT